MSMSDWRSYGEGLSPEYKFPSGVRDFQNSVGAANVKIGRIKRTCIEENKQSEQNLPQLFPRKKNFVFAPIKSIYKIREQHNLILDPDQTPE